MSVSRSLFLFVSVHVSIRPNVSLFLVFFCHGVSLSRISHPSFVGLLWHVGTTASGVTS